MSHKLGLTRQIVRKVSELTLVAALSASWGCSLSGNNQSSVTVDMGGSSHSGSLDGLFKLDLGGMANAAAGGITYPSTVDEFDCYAVNVIGPDISNYGGKSFNTSNPMSCRYEGITSSLVAPASNGTITVKVPPGGSRYVQVLGLMIGGKQCSTFKSPGDASYYAHTNGIVDGSFYRLHLGGTSVDIYGDTSVTVDSVYDSASPIEAFNCYGNNVDSYHELIAGSGDILGWWKMDETSGSMIDDASSSNITGTLNGSYSTGVSSPVKDGGTAVDMSTGGNMYTTSPAGAYNLAANQPFTFEFWGRLNGGCATTMTVVKMDNSPTPYSSFNFQCSPSGMLFMMTDSSNTTYQSGWTGTMIDNNAWHHFAGVYDGGYMYLYVDGSQAASNIVPSFGTFTPNLGVTIVKDYAAYDELVFYNRALSSAEIAQRWNLRK